jgi:hypothetical protein
VTPNRSAEEIAMRALIVPELRKRYSSARIIHELPVRYSTNRIDLAAVTSTQIVCVEIKSSKDVVDRLEAQLRAFLPVSARVIVALAPKWNVKLPEEVETTGDGVDRTITNIRQPRTCAQDVINRVRDGGSLETWTVDAEAGSIDVTERAYRDNRPWHAKMLDMLHVAELVEIAGRHGCWQGKRPVHLDLVEACNELMTGREIAAAVCGALRVRDAFSGGTDAPLSRVAAQAPPSSAHDDSIASPGPASSAVNPRSTRNPQASA